VQFALLLPERLRDLAVREAIGRQRAKLQALLQPGLTPCRIGLTLTRQLLSVSQQHQQLADVRVQVISFLFGQAQHFRGLAPVGILEHAKMSQRRSACALPSSS